MPIAHVKILRDNTVLQGRVYPAGSFVEVDPLIARELFDRSPSAFEILPPGSIPAPAPTVKPAPAPTVVVPPAPVAPKPAATPAK